MEAIPMNLFDLCPSHGHTVTREDGHITNNEVHLYWFKILFEKRPDAASWIPLIEEEPMMRACGHIFCTC